MLPLRVENPSHRFPLVTALVVLANVAVYAYQLSLGPLGENFIWKYAAVPASLLTLQPIHPAATLFPPLTVLTSMFLHGGLWHLLGNLLFLWVFSRNVEDKLGHLRYPVFYLLCGTLSVLIQAATNPQSTLPIIGASGAIAGVMGAYFLRFPWTRVLTLVIFFYFIRVVRVPALVYLGLWFTFQLLVGAPTLGSTHGGVAYFAHIGGFVSGMVLFKVMEKYK